MKKLLQVMKAMCESVCVKAVSLIKRRSTAPEVLKNQKIEFNDLAQGNQTQNAAVIECRSPSMPQKMSGVEIG
jgi:ribosomal 50S subunit-recycling heat shock protein